MAGLRIGGLTPLTSIDFPGRLAAVVFCQGCPWRCSYCHNPDLIPPRGPGNLPWGQVLDFLAGRRGLLDGVVFSGGEPTLQASLPDAMHEVRALGFQVALHTAGMYPERLAAVLPLVDWVGLDIKGPARHYDAITRTPGSGTRVMASLDLVVASGVDYECRTTWDPELFCEDELINLVGTLAAHGVRHWALQPRGTAGRPSVPPEGIAHRLAAAYPHVFMRLP
ncbi:7-carboxy-7-deazaguanine synthase [Cupriavidus laharis]|uniref:7-carboxy-7-deazaguanine synthase n=1 Tax=Cupriavidus laharis TaxID=151654 RepID=A0ABM8XSB2_9BURK|nr:anaerobic ribonucleoside-triphosphate reductase activating protein [Cupriavidus laharis]CAG9183200.1 7-carboxy-7-deazaguanine synthase [Cupriavidus laharis]